jgi:hypothetical protein
VDGDEKGSVHCVNELGGRASNEVRTRMVPIALTGRGVVTLGDYTSDVNGEDGRDGCDCVDSSWSYHAG